MIDLDIDKLSSVICQPSRNLILKVHAKLLQEKEGRKENFHQIFSFKGNNYCKLDLQSFLTLEIKDEEPWVREKSLIIDQNNLFHILKGLNKSLDYIYKGDVFAMNKDNEVIMFKDKQDKCTVKIFNLGNTQKLIIKPAVIYDENDISYEGVILYFSKSSIFTELTIDAFESLVFNLKQVNIFIYARLLLSNYLSLLKSQETKESEPKEIIIKDNNTKQNIFTENNAEEVKTNIFKELTNKDVFNFPSN